MFGEPETRFFTNTDYDVAGRALQQYNHSRKMQAYQKVPQDYPVKGLNTPTSANGDPKGDDVQISTTTKNGQFGQSSKKGLYADEGVSVNRDIYIRMTSLKQFYDDWGYYYHFVMEEFFYSFCGYYFLMLIYSDPDPHFFGPWKSLGHGLVYATLYSVKPNHYFNFWFIFDGLVIECMTKKRRKWSIFHETVGALLSNIGGAFIAALAVYWLRKPITAAGATVYIGQPVLGPAIDHQAIFSEGVAVFFLVYFFGRVHIELGLRNKKTFYNPLQIFKNFPSALGIIFAALDLAVRQLTGASFDLSTEIAIAAVADDWTGDMVYRIVGQIVGTVLALVCVTWNYYYTVMLENRLYKKVKAREGERDGDSDGETGEEGK